MRGLTAPTDDPISVWDICTEGVRDPKRKRALLAARNDVIKASTKYVDLAKARSLHTFHPMTSQSSFLEKELSNWLYDQKLVGGNGKQRAVYDRIKSVAIDDLCPFCNHRDVYDLDHFLPKEEFHLLAVNPLNLVPLCKECNVNKKAYWSSNQAQTFFHPYFDVPDGRWLSAVILEGRQPVVQFEVVAVSGWSTEDLSRAEFQFCRLKLNRLYRAQTAAEIRVLSRSLKGVYGQGGENGRRRLESKLFELAAEREAAGLNDWKYAMLDAMARSYWYCSGGFLLPNDK